MADEALQEAERLAQAEGLTLVRAVSLTGFKWVTVDRRDGVFHHISRPYRAKRKPKHGTSFDLGTFPSAAEAALAIARRLGPDASRDAAALAAAGKRVYNPGGEFGVSQRLQEVEVTALEVVCDHDEDDGGAAVEIVPATEVGAKRKRQAECPATKLVMTSQHALAPADADVQDGVAYINVAVRVPVGMRVPTSVTVEWAP